MFNGGFKEAIESCATLPEDSPHAFDVLMEWVYHSRLRDLQCQDGGIWNYGPFEFYILAERLCVTDILNDSMDMMRKGYMGFHKVPADKHIELAYSNCHERSPLRKFAVRMLYYKYFPGTKRETLKLHALLKRNDDLMLDYLDMSRAKMKTSDYLSPAYGPNSDYHIPT